MPLRPRSLSLENLESRLNLSSLAGLAAPTADISSQAQEQLIINKFKVISLNDYLRATNTLAAGARQTTAASAASILSPASLTTSVTSTAISLKWTDRSSNELAFRIYRSTDGQSFQQIGTASRNRTTYSDPTAALGVTYYYAVAAYDSTAQSALSNVSMATRSVPVTAPLAPTAFSAAPVAPDAIALSWSDNATNETGYHLYRSTDGTNFTLVGDLSANTSTFTDTGLNAATHYTYTVAAWNSAKEVFVANPASATTLAAPTPPAPTIVAPGAPTSVAFSAVSSNSLSLNWPDNASNEDGFHVYRSTDGVTYTKIADLAANATTYSDSGLASSTTYYYQVAAFNSAGETAAAPVSQSTLAPPVIAPTAPSGVQVSNPTLSSLTVSWTDNSNDESGFHVYRSTDGVNFSLVADLPISSNAFTDSGLAAGTSYTYKVASWNSGGETPALVASGTTIMPVVAPANLAFSSVTANSLTLSWTDTSTSESGCRVYRSTDGTNFTKIADLAANTTSYADAGLTASTTYYYKISSWNSAGETLSAAANTTTAAIAPAAPSTPTFASVTSTGLTLNWTDTSANESGFRVYRSTDGTNFTKLADLAANTTSFSDAGLAASTTYYYRVSSWNSAGETLSAAASSTTAAPPVVTPAAPGTPAFSGITSNSLTLSWTDNSPNESGFRVYRSTDGTNFTLLTSLAPNTTSYSDGGLSATTTYFYKVSSWNSAGEALSAAASTTTAVVVVPPAAPGTPTFSSVTTTSLTVSWADNSSSESGFRVLRSSDGTNFTKVADLPANTTSYADSGLSPATTYYYRITSWNSAFESYSPGANTTTAALVVAPAAPGTPTFSSVTSSGLTLAWTDNSSNESGFRVYRSTDGTNFTQVASLAANTTSYADSSLSASTTYFYKVSSWNSAGETLSAAAISTTAAVAPIAPGAPTFSSITSSGLTLAWTDNSTNESGFRVYRSTNGTTFSQIASLAAGTTSFADSGLSASTTYYYKISSWNSAGETLSAVANTTTAAVAPIAPGAPTFSSITSNGLTLNWTDNSANESGFRVYRSTDGTTFSQVASLAAGTTSYADGGLSASTTYYYKISSWNSAGETLSAAANTTTAAVAPIAPGAPTFSSITSNGLTLNWTDNSANESGFRVYRSTDGTTFSQIASLAAGTTSFADSGLSASTTYYYKVSSWNSAGETLSTAASTATSANTSSPVTFAVRNMTSFNELDITGTSGNDSIYVSQSGGILTIVANGATTTYANVYGNLVIHGGNGNDTITVDSSVNIATLIYGGDGNDVIKNQTSAKATIVTIGNGTNTVTGNGINTAFWVNPGDTVNATTAETNLGGVNRVTTWYQPLTTDPTNPNYVPRSLYGQNLTDPSDSGTVKRLTANSFWGTGPVASDINQTSLSDCYFLAPLASLANNEPQRLMNMAVDLGDGTYAVRFARGGVISYVRVDGDLAAGGWTWGLANQMPGSDGNQWGSIFEKAYAFYRNSYKTYASLDYGFQSSTFTDLGLTVSNAYATSGASYTLNLITTLITSGKSIASDTNSTINGGAPIIASHVYSIFGAYTDASGTVWIQLRNPWGVDGAGSDANPYDGLVTITYAQFAANFDIITSTTI